MAQNQVDVSSFIANFQGGGLRPSRYKVILSFPSEVGGAQTALKVSFTCKATTVPASTVGVAIAPYMGRQIKLAGDREFMDWNITVLLDTDFASRDAFEVWSDNMNGHASNVAIPGWGNPSSYMANAEVHLLDAEGNTVRTYILEGTWPTSVGEINLGYDQTNQIAEMQVTLAVQNWKRAGLAGAES